MDSLQATLKNTRKVKSLTQHQLAERALVTQARISKFEKGDDVTLSTLEQIALALDMQIIAIPRNKQIEVAQLLEPEKHTSISLLERFRVSDDDE